MQESIYDDKCEIFPVTNQIKYVIRNVLSEENALLQRPEHAINNQILAESLAAKLAHT